MPDQLSTIRDLVLERYAATASDPLFDPSVVDRIINVSNKRLGRVADWPWLMEIGTVAFAASVNTYTLTGLTNFRHIKFLSHGNRKLAYKNPQAFVKYNSSTAAGSTTRTETPGLYTVVGNTLLIASTPSAATTLDIVYVVDENDLVSDGSTPRLPSGYTELLVLATMPALAMRKKDQEFYNMAKMEYKEALADARDEVRRTRQNPVIEVDEFLWVSA